MEKFSWVPHEFLVDEGVGNQVIIRGKALTTTISRNNRVYIEEELVKAARTLRGKPITINHDSTKIVGNVEWAEYEDGFIEYLGKVKKNPYVDRLSDGRIMTSESYYAKWRKKPIRNVSVEADFLRSVCPKCGEEFEGDKSTDALTKHLRDSHSIRNFELKPKGIYFTALSLVEDPEEPGVEGTTLEVVDSEQKIVECLLAETAPKSVYLSYIFDVTKFKNQQKEETKMMKKPNVAISEIPSVSKTVKLPEVKEQEKHDCAEGEVWSDEEGKCVPVKTEEPVKPKMVEAKLDPLAKEIAPQTQPTINYKAIYEILRLGEPFADYTDFADCVAKNQDKGDPDAYCAVIKRQVEGETKKSVESIEEKQKRDLEEFQKKQKEERFEGRIGAMEREALSTRNTVGKLTQTISISQESFGKSLKTLDSQAHTHDKPLVSQDKLDEVASQLTTKFMDVIKEKMEPIITIVDTVQKEYPKVQEKQVLLEKDNAELRKEKAEQADKIKQLEELTSKTSEKTEQIEKKVTETKDKEIKETTELKTRVENLEAKQKGNFTSVEPKVASAEKPIYLDKRER